IVDDSHGPMHHGMHDHAIKNLKRKVIAAIVLSLPMLYFMLLDFIPGMPGSTSLLPYIGIISLVLTTPVQFVIGRDFYQGTWSSLRMRTFNMDSLIAIGTSVAYLYSLAIFTTYAVQNSSLIAAAGTKIGGLYFETAAFLVTFVLIGKLLEARAKHQASNAI